MQINTCPNCGNTFTLKYCNNCGQKLFSDKDRTFSGMIEEVFHFMTHFEGTFFKSFKAILFHPARLSNHYISGIRKRYYKPISFMLMVIVIYLLFPLAEGLNQRLDFYKTMLFFGDMLNQQIADQASALSISEVALDKLFREKAVGIAKVLLLLLVPLTAVSLYLLYPRTRKKAYDIMIVSTEINSYVILLFFIILPLLFRLPAWLFDIILSEQLLSTILSVVFPAYLYIVLFRFFQQRWYITLAKTIFFMILYFVCTQIIYKFILFQIVMMLL